MKKTRVALLSIVLGTLALPAHGDLSQSQMRKELAQAKIHCAQQDSWMKETLCLKERIERMMTLLRETPHARRNQASVSLYSKTDPKSFVRRIDP